MQIKKIAFVLCSFFFISFLQSCGGNSIDSKLDKVEKLIKKWESKTENGQIKKENCPDFLNDIQDAGGKQDIGQEKGVTSEQIERATSLGKRLSALAMDCL